MKKKIFSGLIASAVFSVLSITTSVAQTNLGSECGCPPVSGAGARTTVLLSSLGVNANGELLANQTLTCDNIYVLDQKIYVPNGITLTIKPGCLIKGNSAANPANATALIIERGGKIIADGKENCPIVFTSAADPMDGTHPLTNVGEWGGIVLLGTATNNLIVGNTYCGGTNGVGFVEGFSAANPRDLYGAGDAAFPTANDNDNSGILRYVSVRHAGAILAVSNELNGISLGSVGRGTTIEHVEVIANADDNMEFFGGTVDIKYASTVFGDDDMFDYDLGYKGRMQFLFGLASDSLTGVHSTDNGFECDADDNSKAPALKSHPVIHNATIIGNGHINPTLDNTGPAAIMAKELTEGEFHNCIFADFRSGLHLANARSNGTNKGDAYDNWTDASNAYNTVGGNAAYHSLLVKNNTFVGFGTTYRNRAYFMTTGAMVQGGSFTKVYKDATPVTNADTTQFYNDGNRHINSVTGIDYSWLWNAAKTGFDNPYHAVPTSNITTPPCSPVNDGWFTIVNYRGAFDATKPCWLTSENYFVPMMTMIASNPTDLNYDGVTDINDFSIFVGKFGQVNQ